MRFHDRKMKLLLMVFMACIWCMTFTATVSAASPGGGNARDSASSTTRYVTIDFDGVDIAVFIKYISEITGKSFVVGNKVRGKVSVIGAEKVTVDDAYDIFESVLEVHGYTTETSGQVTKIVTK